MAERGIDISHEFPKPWTDETVCAADVVITMGCGDACPIFPGKRYESWDDLDDPVSTPQPSAPSATTSNAASDSSSTNLTSHPPLINLCGAENAQRQLFDPKTAFRQQISALIDSDAKYCVATLVVL